MRFQHQQIIEMVFLEVLVTLYTKLDDFNLTRQDFSLLTDKVFLPFSECEIALEEIYYDIEFL